MKNVVLAAIGFLLAAASACNAQTEQPSLGELAKAGHSARKAGKTITNDDIATSAPQGGSGQVVTAPGAAAADTTPATGPSAKSEEKKGSAAASKDSPAAAELRKKLDSYKEQRDGWKTSAKRYEDLLATETTDFRRQMYQNALDSDRHNVAFFQEKMN
ncbi:MAG TPA: hypothetical protein VH724_02485, partial [Candidatus Angelobacter sp.]|nr:hypothetical protein [Candidatus Angelobacter sp.]